MENKGEQERRELNKRLLSRTFKCEMQDRRKISAKSMVIDYAVLFIVLLLAELVTNWFALDSWMVELGIAMLVGIPMFALKSWFIKE